ncbi:MAG TPA: amidohydrolase family protein [Steroidobacteraceae bacterium]|nr:amidohydrolase family protein [Steroidobacteraceae bacterium]
MRLVALLPLLLLPAAQAAEPPVLFRGATLITMDAPGVLERHDLLVRDGRIAGIAPSGSIAPPAGTVIVDAGGRFLMPGLAEMHAHVPGPEPAGWAEDVLLLYLGHGLTTVRGMLGQPAHLELRTRLERGELLGPRLFTSGPSVNGNSAPDAATAARMVREQKEAGYDFVKIHPGLKPEVFDAMATAARAAGIPFEGHVSAQVGVRRALAAGQRAIDHLDQYVEALAREGCTGTEVPGGFFGIGLTDCADRRRIPELVAATRAAGAWMAPTQVLIEQWARPPPESELRARGAWRYVSPATAQQWARTRSRFESALPFADRFIRLRRELLMQMHAANVPILLASDAPQLFNIPGDSALAELELYGEMGMPALDALATGTVNVARFFGQEDRFGRLREGLEADLLLLGADPRADLGNVRKLEGVMIRGRWLPREKLDELLEGVAGRQARRH